MIKKVLIIKNITLEGPGLLELFLKKRNIAYEIQDLSTKCVLPEPNSDIGAVVILGGPMNVDEEDRFPFLRGEKQFIDCCLQRNIPLLGICLGAQLLASVLGAKVFKNQQPEFGCMEVELTEPGKENPLFSGINSPVQVFQWHGDTFDLPRGCEWLAKSSLCLQQAFTYKNRAFGLQFHMEVVLDDAKQWAEIYLPILTGEEKKAAQRIREMKHSQWPESISKTAEILCTNFITKIASFITIIGSFITIVAGF